MIAGGSVPSTIITGHQKSTQPPQAILATAPPVAVVQPVAQTSITVAPDAGNLRFSFFPFPFSTIVEFLKNVSPYFI